MNTPAPTPAADFTDEQVDAAITAWFAGGKFDFEQRMRDALRAALSSPAPAQAAPSAVPEGYAVVPVEPTPEMVAAYLAANHTYWKEMDEGPAPIGKWRNGTPSEATAESYAAMLAAAPVPAAPAHAGDVLLTLTQRLSQNPYSLTKAECIQEVRKLREELGTPKD